VDAIFDWCVAVLVYFAGMFGITYKEINVWVFVILWPALTLVLVVLLTAQQIRLRRLQRKLKEGKG
jgi:hypothetical protein